MTREQHSADWSDYIEHVGAMRWDIIFGGKHLGSFPTRETARIAIRGEKIHRAARELGGYPMLTKKDFDAICKRLGLDPDDDDLVERLVALGWVFNHYDDEYISPDKPTGRWKLFLEGLDDPEPAPPPGRALAARAMVRAAFQAKPKPQVPFGDDDL